MFVQRADHAFLGVDAAERGVGYLALQLVRNQQAVVLGIVNDENARRFAHVHGVILEKAGAHGASCPNQVSVSR